MFFDTNAHPTLDGNWLAGRKGQTFKEYSEELKSIGGRGAYAVGLPGVGGYQHGAFFNESLRHDLVPVAGLRLDEAEDLKGQLDEIVKTGFQMVKIHPRLMGISHLERQLEDVLVECGNQGLKVLLCTYSAGTAGQLPATDPYYQICRALNRLPSMVLLLLHGGVTRLMDYSLLARHTSGVFLDLSYTIMKYRRSSLDSDIQFLVEDLDQKLTIGSDSPEYSLLDVSTVISNYVGRSIESKKENVLYRNALQFVNQNP